MPRRWLDLEVARRRAVGGRPALAHDAILFRQPVTTLDDHLARGLRVEALRDLVDGFEPRDEDDDAVVATRTSPSVAPVLRPPSVRDFYAFEGHVRTMWERRGGEIPEAWYRLPGLLLQQRLGDPRAGRAGLVAGGVARARLRARDRRGDRHAGVGPVARPRRGGHRRLSRSSTTGPRATSSATRRRSVSARPRARTSPRSFGPWLVTPDELADARRGTGYDLAMTATGERHRDQPRPLVRRAVLVRRACSPARRPTRRLRPGDLIGSGTVGSGCLLEVRDATLGRYLEPGDEVVLRVDRLGALRSPIVVRPV